MRWKHMEIGCYTSHEEKNLVMVKIDENYWEGLPVYKRELIEWGGQEFVDHLKYHGFVPLEIL